MNYQEYFKCSTMTYREYCKYLQDKYGIPKNSYYLGSIMTRAHKIGIKRRDLPIRCVENRKIFNSIKEATEFAGLQSGKCIRKCCKGESKTAGGYHWEYVEEESQNTDNTRE